jgi:hypothetical protein
MDKLQRALLIFMLFICTISFAGEGYWPVSSLYDSAFVASLNNKGLELSPEEIYSPVSGSLNSAIVRLSVGCTGGLVSSSGLVLTNMHCLGNVLPGMSMPFIDSLGFIAEGLENEIVLPGVSAYITIAVADYSDSLPAITENAKSFGEKKYLIDSAKSVWERNLALLHGGKATAQASIYYNKLHIYVEKEFADVRLVLVPPQHVNFGRRPDNWEWPRHSADFSFLRIYSDTTDSSGVSAKRPYLPGKHLQLAGKAIEENDFCMLLGFPTTSKQYMTSQALRTYANNVIKPSASLRADFAAAYSGIIGKHGQGAFAYSGRLYSAKNAQKRYSRALEALELSGAYHLIKSREDSLCAIDSAVCRLASEIDGVELRYAQLNTCNEILLDAIVSSDVFLFSVRLSRLFSSTGNIDALKSRLAAQAANLFVVDNGSSNGLLAAIAARNIYSSCPGIAASFSRQDVEALYKKSILADSARLVSSIKSYTSGQKSRLQSDKMYQLLSGIYDMYMDVDYHIYIASKLRLDSLYHIYWSHVISASGSLYYPEASANLRLSYGTASGFSPIDAVEYSWRSTGSGVKEKFISGADGYASTSAFIEFAGQAEKQGINICFISSAHTSGGNSGSPVLNSKGKLVGINFDRTGYSTMSEYFYHPGYSRNIISDAFYIKSILGDYLGAAHLLDEMGWSYKKPESY